MSTTEQPEGPLIELVYGADALEWIVGRWPQAETTDARDIVHDERWEVRIPGVTEDEFYPEAMYEGVSGCLLGFGIMMGLRERKADVERWLDKAKAIKAAAEGEDAYKAFMSMPRSEWLGLIESLLRGGVLTPAEQEGFERAERDRRLGEVPIEIAADLESWGPDGEFNDHLDSAAANASPRPEGWDSGRKGSGLMGDIEVAGQVILDGRGSVKAYLTHDHSTEKPVRPEARCPTGVDREAIATGGGPGVAPCGGARRPHGRVLMGRDRHSNRSGEQAGSVRQVGQEGDGMTTLRLHREQSGLYVTEDGRYRIEHQDNYTDCEHPLCETLHRRFHERTFRGDSWSHTIPYVAWHVWDTVTDDYAGGNGPEEFDSKREAMNWLIGYLEDRRASTP